MNLSLLLLVASGILEVVLIVMVLAFFMRLKRSEALLTEMREKQEAFVSRLHFNAQLEKELVESFETRQKELGELERKLSERERELKLLLKEAERQIRSPAFLRESVSKGLSRGLNPTDIARDEGISFDEIEIISKSKKGG